MTDKKSERELKILNNIFQQEENFEIKKSEQPDFILIYTHNPAKNISVGVEITELYFNETSARLANKEGYIKNLIDGRNIHKNDTKNLEVKSVTYLPKANNFKPFETKMVFLPNYTTKDFQNTFLSILRKKNKKFDKYNKNINQCSLVIHDSENYFRKIKREDFIATFFNSTTLEEVKNSPFNEIYLITTFNGESGSFFIQLKFCQLLNELAKMLDHFKNKTMFYRKIKLNLNFNDIFSEILTRANFPKIGKLLCNNENTISCDRYAIGINEDGNIHVFDNHPELIKGEKLQPLTSKTNFFNAKSFNRYQENTKNKFASFKSGFKSIGSI